MMKKYMYVALTVIVTILYVQPACAAINVNVTVVGVENNIKKNVLALLSIERQKKHQDLTQSLLKKLHEKAPDEIRQALQPFGYYRPDIQVELVLEESTWNARYTIAPGKPVIIDTIDIVITGKGRDHKKFKHFKEKSTLKKGDILNHPLYEITRRLLLDTALNIGFLNARMVTSKIEVHAEKGVAHILIHFDTGPQFHFGRVSFLQDEFSQDFLARFVPFRRGKPYEVSKILDLQKALNNSDYFEVIEISPRIDLAEDLEVPIDIKLIARKRNKYKFGLGYGTDTGFRGSVGWEITRINKSGHRFGITIKASEIKSGVNGEYTIPLKDPRTESLVFSSGFLKEDNETSTSEKIFSGVRFNHMRWGWKESIYLNYEEEDFDVGDDEGRSTLLIPGSSWTKIWAENPVNTKHGLRIYFNIRGAYESLISDTSFLQFHSQLKYIRSLWPGGRIIMRGEGGSSIMSEFSELPASVRFFAGGDHSVRGYAYNTLGPEDESGDIAGGRHLVVGSIEYEQRIWGNWSAAVFYDAGNAIDSFSEPIESSAGFGVRWKSLVGPVRIDLAFPLSISDRGRRIHFMVGPDL